MLDPGFKRYSIDSRSGFNTFKNTTLSKQKGLRFLVKTQPFKLNSIEL